MTESSRALNKRRLLVVLLFTASFLAVEVGGAVYTGSLALLADAGHMLTDVGGLSLAIFALWFAERPATPEKTYGYYRVEILAALANATVLFFISGYILYEAYRRFQSAPEMEGAPILVVAALGLAVNMAGIWLLRRGAQGSLNVQGAFLEVVSDALGSLGVIVAGLVILTTRFYLIDPIISVLIGLFILPRTWRLMNNAVNVLLEATPAHISLSQVRREMLDLPGVRDVHDLHVWTITSGLEAMSGHVWLDGAADRSKLLLDLGWLLRERFGIEHITIQFEEEEMGEPRDHQ